MRIFRTCIIPVLVICAFPLRSLAQNQPAPASDAGSSSASRFWTRADYLAWWIKGNPLPPIVTSSPPGTSGVLPGAEILFGGSSVDGGERNGARLSLGYWFDDQHDWGLDAGLILVGFNTGSSFAAASDGTPILARPFVNTSLNGPDSLFIAAPGVDTGAISVSTSNQLQSVSLELRRHWLRAGDWRMDMAAGYRYLRFRETLTIQDSENFTSLETTGAGTDYFSADNAFDGGVAGLVGEWNHRRFSLNLAGNVSLGDQHEVGRINGQSTFGGVSSVGDFLALSSNIGTRSQDRFGVLPELDVTGRYAFGKFSVNLGYTALFLNKMLRTGGQIDENINPALLPPETPGGPASPHPQMRDAPFWTQGLSAGLEFRY